MQARSAAARILAAGALVIVAGAAAAQQAYPSKPIRFIVPYAPGSGTGALARLIGQRLSESWGQPVLVDDRGGGNTIIGSEALVKSNPDGHTILAMASTHVIVPLLIPTPFDAIKDFAAVTTLTSNELLLALNASVPANNLREFIALAKSRPGQLNYASGGSGTVTHLTAELFNIAAQVKIQHIPYKGAGPAMADLIGGQVQLFFTSPVNTIPHIKSGKLRALAISGETRLPALPEVPTFTEAGIKHFDVKVWYGVLAPAGTPKAVIGKLSAEIARILRMPDTKEKLDGQGMDPFISGPEAFAVLMKADTAKYARVIKTAKIKVDQ